MATFTRFEDIDAWKIAREISKDLFILFENGSLNKDFVLWNQINSSSGSIMDNIAEGHERGGRKEFIQFLSYAKGSCGEVRSQLYRMRDRKYISDEQFSEFSKKTEQCIGKITNLMIYLQGSKITGNNFRF
jgi:four helix bundle protein